MWDSLTDSLTTPLLPAQEDIPLGLENRCTVKAVPGVRIPPPPLSDGKSLHTTGNQGAMPHEVVPTVLPLETAGNRPFWCRTRSRLAHACLGIPTVVVLTCVAMTVDTASAAPCSAHSATTKVTKAECMKAHTAQAKRDAVRWPSYPVTTRDLNARGVQIRKWVNLGRCEAGLGSGYGGVRWNTPGGWRWQGGLGMYDRSHASTGHRYGYDAGRWNWQTQVLVGHRLMEKYGISAWSAARCWR